MYTIEFSQIAWEDLRYFKRYEQNIIIEAIETQLTHQPTVETTNRFRRQPPEIADWELRTGDYWIFYTVEEIVQIVSIERIGEKPNNELFFRGRKASRR
ncbi:MAG: hypothetical protein KJZ86_16425 [Caldilineaceae bacterium]|nr:hypothetical protein [Caldilineaceae bacterium]